MLKINSNYDEDLYISYFKKNEGKQWKCNLDADYKNAYDSIHQLYPSLNIPDNISDFLLLKPYALIHLYYEIRNQGIIEELEKKFIHSYVPTSGKNKGIQLERVLFDYDSFEEDISEFFCKSASSIDLSTCYYCNMSYINTYTVENGNKTTTFKHFDIDHFIPQDECKLFSLCLYNFVPACSTCNERIKRENLIINDGSEKDLLQLLPSNKGYNFHENIRFRILPKKYMDNNFKDNKIFFHVRLCKAENAQNYDIYNKEAIFFRIPERYDFHKQEFLMYIDKKRIYTPDCIKMMAKTLSAQHIFCNEKMLSEAIFNTEFRKQNERIFKLIYEDIDKTFENN